MNVFGRQFRLWVVWGMVPLAVLSGMPTSACICANGRLKLFCSHRHVAVARPHTANAAGFSAHHDCCGRDAATIDSAAHSDDEDGLDCCNSHGGANGTGWNGAHCGGHCTPLMKATSTAPQVARSPVPSQFALDRQTAEPRVIHDTHRPMGFARRGIDTGPPPLDVLTSFGRLLI